MNTPTKSDQAMQSRDELLQRLRQCVPALFERLPIALAYLYGSVANNQMHAESDIDIALVFSEKLSRLEMLNIELDLNSQLEKCGLFNPDVRGITSAPIEAQAKVIQRGVLLFSKSTEHQSQYESHVTQQAQINQANTVRKRNQLIDQLRAEMSLKGQVNA